MRLKNFGETTTEEGHKVKRINTGMAWDYDDNELEDFYDQLQNVFDQTPKKDIIVVQGD